MVRYQGAERGAEGMVIVMGTQRIRRSKSALYNTDGKKRQHRQIAKRRKFYKRAAEAALPRLSDLAGLAAMQGEG